MSVNVNPQINGQKPYVVQENAARKNPATLPAQNNKGHDKILKPAVLLSEIAGVSLAVLNIAQVQKGKLVNVKKFSDIFEAKNWNVQHLKYEWKEILKIAAGSITGGFTAGVILDGDNKKAKMREALQQMVGNVSIPVGLVTVTSWLFEKNKAKIKIPKIKSDSKFAKSFNEKSFEIVKGVSMLGALGVGIITGNEVANKLSEIVFGAKDKRHIQLGDFSGHIDDICLATTLISPNNKIAQMVGKFIPIALLVAGFDTGTIKNKTNQKDHA